MRWMFSFIAIMLFTFAPVLPLFVLDLLGLADGLNESNSSLAVLPWLMFLTLPAGAVAFAVWLVALLIKLSMRFWNR